MNKTKNKTDLKTKQKNNTAPKAKTGDVAKSQAAAKPKAPAKSKSTAQTEKSSEPKATFKIRKNHNLDPYFDGEKLYAVGGGRYIQFNGVGTLPADITGFMDRTGRKPPFMLLPEMSVDFYLSKGFGGSSKVHWAGEGKLPDAVISYLNDHGTLPRTRENTEDDEEFEDEAEEENFE